MIYVDSIRNNQRASSLRCRLDVSFLVEHPCVIPCHYHTYGIYICYVVLDYEFEYLDFLIKVFLYLRLSHPCVHRDRLEKLDRLSDTLQCVSVSVILHYHSRIPSFKDFRDLECAALACAPVPVLDKDYRQCRDDLLRDLYRRICEAVDSLFGVVRVDSGID